MLGVTIACAFFVFQSIALAAGVTLVSGEIAVQAKASYDSQDVIKSDSARRDTVPGDAPLSIQSENVVGQNGMIANGAADLQSTGSGDQLILRGAGGPTAFGFINNTADPGTFRGTGTGRVTYTFTLTRAYQWDLTALVTGEVKTSTGVVVNPVENNATVRLAGIFELTSAGTGSKEQTTSGILGPGTYTIEGVANAFATNAQRSRSNYSFFLALTPLMATTIQWNNSAGGLFQSEANWDPENVPGANDVAEFGLQAAYTVTVGTAATSRLVLRNGAVTFTNLNYTVGATAFDPASIALDNASLILANGILHGVHALIGESAASRVEVNAGARWTNTGSLRVGGPGEGILAIADGGAVTSGEGQIATGVGGGDVILAGFNATWDSGNLAVGFSGTGTLTISDGAEVTSEKVTVGLQSGASGLVNIEGASPAGMSSEWNCVELIVGEAGTGNVKVGNSGKLSLTGKTTVNDTLLIENGGRSVHNSQPLVIGELGIGDVSVRGVNVGGDRASMTSVSDFTIGQARAGFLTIVDGGSASGVGDARVGVSAAGEVFVKGSETHPASWLMDGDLSVGVGNNGKVDIVEGALVSARDVILGVNPGSVGKITVGERSALGRSDLFADGQIFVGLEGSGTMVIEEGGLVVCAEGAVGGFGGSQGVVELGVTGASGETAEWQVDGNLTVGGGSGRVVLRNGAIVEIGGQLTVLPNGAIHGTGSLVAPLRLVQNGGVIDPGLSPGTLTIDANYEQTSTGTLKMEAAGLGTGQFDVLHVTGNATLGGTMEVTFLDGYLPKTGDALPLLQVDGAVSGGFAQITFPQLAPGFEFETQMVNGKFQLTALNDGVRLFAKGTSQVLLAGEPARHEAAGLFTIRTSARGGFSARFILGGQRFALRGKFDDAGRFTETIPRRGDSPLTVTFEPSATDRRLVIGTITDGEHTIAISTERANAFKAKTHPAPQTGKYTAVLQFDPAAGDAPKANGIGVVAVSKSGAVRFAGALPDGTRLSQSTVLSESGEWPLYVLLHEKQGSLFGTLQFRDEPGSDFDGILHWSRPTRPGRDSSDPGFLTTLAAIGSRYLAPPAQPAMLTLPSGAIVILTNPDSTVALTRSLTLAPPNQFVVTDPGPDKLSITAKSSRGLLSGTFIHPITHLSTKVQGAVFQKQNRGSGFSLSSQGSGLFDLQAKP